MARSEVMPISKEHQDALKMLCSYNFTGKFHPMYKVDQKLPHFDFALPESKIGFVLKNRQFDPSLFPGWLILRIMT